MKSQITKYSIIALVIGFTAVSPSIRARQSASSAKVHLVTVDSAGHDLGEVNVASFKSEYDGREFAKQFVGNDAKAIPYGEYRIKIYKQGFFPTTADVYVYQPSVWLLLGVSLGEEQPIFPSPSWVASGRIDGIQPADQPIFVKLLGVYLPFFTEDRVQVTGNTGTFSLAGVNVRGKFILLAIGKTGVIATREVELPSNGPITIDLSLRK